MKRRDFILSTGAGVAALSVSPALAVRAFGGTPLALVTADAQAHVAVVDPATGRVRRRISTLELPRSIEAVKATQAVVAHSELGRVTLIDGVRLKARALKGRLGEPRYTAAHPNGRHVYITDSLRGEVVVLDVLRAKIVRRVDVGGPARHLGIDRFGRKLWVALGSKASEVATLSLKRATHPRLVRRFSPPFLAHDVVFAPGGKQVWITSGDQRRIVVYNASTGRIIRRLAADAPPQHVAFGARVAYVTSGDDGTLRAHALNGRLLRETQIPISSYNVSADLGFVVTPSLSRGTLGVLTRHARPLRKPRIATAAHDACLVMGR